VTASSDLPTALVDALAGNYELLQEIGRGGMGIVYAGRDIRLDRLVAIKVLPDLASTDAVRERFLREAKAAARLSHPSIVPIYSADDRNGVTFMVMAYVDGTTLTARLRDGRALAPQDAVPILRDVALALDCAHSRGVIHRDVKPENILVDRLTGRAMVTDFGIARLADAMQAGALTRTGQVLGTVGYMSPEQVTDADIDGRSDLYSLGVVAFECLAGKLPFDGPAPVVIVAHATRPAPALSSIAPHLPAELCALVDRLLRKNPDDRFATGTDVAKALEQAVGTSVATTPTRVAATGEDRILTEKEADRVWRRAAELQAGIGAPTVARAPTASMTAVPRTAASGFRLEHVRQAAIEAGISAAYVTLALDELVRPRTAVRPVVAAASAPVPARETGGPVRVPAVRCLNPPKSWLLGGPGSLLYEVEIPGQISPDDFDVIAHSIRSTFGEAGVTNTLGRSLSWTSAGFNRQRHLHISIAASDGRTQIRAEENLREFVGVTMGGIVAGVGGLGSAIVTGFAAGAMHLGATSAIVPVAGLSLAYAVAKKIVVRNTHMRAMELQGLVERLAVQAAMLIANDQDAKSLPRNTHQP
jgi:predicted Ser/Thr protein kinase